MELLQYLDMEQSWLNTLEEKLQATENLPESTEAVNEALEVKTHTCNEIQCNSVPHSNFCLIFLLNHLLNRQACPNILII